MSPLDHPDISRQVFFPRPTGWEPDLTVDVEGAVLGCHIRRPHRNGGLVLHFHGNGETAADYADMFGSDFFGADACFVEYRGYGRSTGRPALVGMLGDGEQVLHALGLPPERVVAFGRSLGSLYAIELAHRFPTLAGLVVESGVADLADNRPPEKLAGGDRAVEIAAAYREHFDHDRKLAGYRGPVLVLHAEHDTLLDRSHADRLYAWSGSSDKRLVVLPNGGHNTILPANTAAYTNAVADFLHRAGVAPGA